MSDLMHTPNAEAVPDAADGALPTHSAAERESARKRLEARQGPSADAVSYVVVNAFLLGVWAITGSGYFWPAWIMAAWGVGLALHAWDVFYRKPITDAAIDKELRRHDG